MNGQACQRGVSLVAVLVATALGVTLLSAIAATAVGLVVTSQHRNDEAQLLSRSLFMLRLLHADLSAAAVSPFILTHTEDVCSDPLTQGFLGLVRVEAVETAPCLFTASAASGQSVWVLDTLRRCKPEDCAGTPLAELPTAFWCDGQWALRLRRERGALGCIDIAMGMVWQRRAFHLRNYAWQAGDGGSAVMVRQFNPETKQFGRAEMLLQGVRAWRLDTQAVAGFCQESSNAGAMCGYEAAHLQLLLEGEMTLPFYYRAAFPADWPYQIGSASDRRYRALDFSVALGSALGV